MSKHIADRRAPSKGGRVRAFMKIARQRRDSWHRPEGAPTNRRVVEFVRIARGRTT
jgi:hypothetical protein